MLARGSFICKAQNRKEPNRCLKQFPHPAKNTPAVRTQKRPRPVLTVKSGRYSQDRTTDAHSCVCAHVSVYKSLLRPADGDVRYPLGDRTAELGLTVGFLHRFLY